MPADKLDEAQTVRRKPFDWLDTITKLANRYTEARVFGRIAAVIFTPTEREVLKAFENAVREDERSRAALPESGARSTEVEVAVSDSTSGEFATRLSPAAPATPRTELLRKLESAHPDGVLGQWCLDAAKEIRQLERELAEHRDNGRRLMEAADGWKAEAERLRGVERALADAQRELASERDRRVNAELDRDAHKARLAEVRSAIQPLNVTVWKDGSYLCQSQPDDAYCQQDPDWLCSIPLEASVYAAHPRSPVTQDGPLGSWTIVGQAASELDLELTLFESAVQEASQDSASPEEASHQSELADRLKREIIEKYTPRSATGRSEDAKS